MVHMKKLGSSCGERDASPDKKQVKVSAVEKGAEKKPGTDQKGAENSTWYRLGSDIQSEDDGIDDGVFRLSIVWPCKKKKKKKKKKKAARVSDAQGSKTGETPYF
eukprot:FR740836.1.p2 GENE.FR740836.1~~FR740836.1.p2  ORF type:complete len:105 (+),score=33.11 FR740836.1:607-921(+)